MNYKRVYLFLSLLLLAIIGHSIWRYSPGSILYDPPIFNGTSWSKYPDARHLTYRAMKGDLKLTPIPRIMQFHTQDGVMNYVNNVTYYALDTGDEIYYLVDRGREPLIRNDLNRLLDAPKVYINGNIFRHSPEDDSILNYIMPIEFSNRPLIDLGKRSESVIIDLHGEQFFRRYFEKPIIWKDSDEYGEYSVSYLYNNSLGHRSGYVTLYFDDNKLLVNQDELPDTGSRLPFKVSKVDARMIAISNGLECNSSSEVSLEFFTRSDEWLNHNGAVPTETYYHSKYCANAVNLTHYVWSVHLYDEVFFEEEYHLVHFALIDVNTGEIYLVDNYRVNWNPWWGFIV